MTDTEKSAADEQGQKLVLVTGPSGAGRLTAVRSLEDFGFEAIDNLPLSLLPRLFDGPPLDHPLALGIDIRNRDFSVQRLLGVLESLGANASASVDLLYLDCRPEVLIRRFSETRRPHPLGSTETAPQAIAREIELLAPIRDQANILIDTSELSPHELRDEIGRWYQAPQGRSLAICVHSFSFKRGTPRGMDMVFDVRFLQNPHWQAELRDLDGLSNRVADFVADDPRFAAFFERIRDLVLMLLPAFAEEGKSYLNIGFGCTGGQHRSVVVAELLAKALEAGDWRVSIRHRELERRAPPSSACAETDGGGT